MPYVPPGWRGTYTGPTRPANVSYNEADVSDKPCLGKPPLSRAEIAFINTATQHRRDALLAADAQIQRCIRIMRSSPRPAALIFLSDNGYMSGEHRIHRGKSVHYEPSSHVPLVVRAPGFAVRREPRLCGIQDLAPTILALAGALEGRGAVSRGGVAFDGQPLQRVVDPSQPERPGVPIEITNAAGRYIARGCVSTDNWKYVELAGGAKCVELYDLDNDPYEVDNLAFAPGTGSRREAMKALTAALGVPA